ncbi:MAG: ABC transporter substrate-binding protein [Defluviitaleaceae bacterium]|nr:ABC transporter substrate-binding protein [Defluviitaleaceae bacterium]MCL2262393.1 ABC transporter substrate-binding protein [Defluviitaleaceae bacterium]
MRKFFVMFALLFLTACGDNAGNEVDRVIRLGFEGGLCQGAIPLAHIKGFFAEEGLETEIVVTGDLVSSRDALMAGHIDTVAGMLAGWFVPVTQGLDIQFTLGLHTGCASAFVLADSAITEFERGQEIAVSGAIGGAFHNIALRFVYRQGLAPEDFTWRDFPAAEAVIALQNGTVQVAVIPDQVGKRFVDEGILRVIRSLDDADFADDTCCVLGMTGQFIAQNPETAAKITRAVYRASRWIDASDENKTAAVLLLKEHDFVSAAVDVDYVAGLMRNWRWGMPHYLTEQTLAVSIAEYQAMGVINPDLEPYVIKAQVWHPFTVSFDGFASLPPSDFIATQFSQLPDAEFEYIRLVCCA